MASIRRHSSHVWLMCLREMSQNTFLPQMIFSERKDGRRRHFRRQHDKKVGALALASLIALPANSLPQELQGSIAQLSAGSIKLLADLQAQKVCSCEEAMPSFQEHLWYQDNSCTCLKNSRIMRWFGILASVTSYGRSWIFGNVNYSL